MSVKRGREASSGQATTMGIRESGISRMCSPSVRVLYFVRSTLDTHQHADQGQAGGTGRAGSFYVLQRPALYKMINPQSNHPHFNKRISSVLEMSILFIYFREKLRE